MTTRQQVDDLAKAQAAVAALAKQELARVLARLDLTDTTAAIEALTELFPALVAKYGDVAAAAAADWYETVMGTAALAADTFPAEYAQQRARSAVLGNIGDPDGIGSALATSLDRYVKQAGRDTIRDSTKRDKARYARVPRGTTTCGFCLMLASRGAVYATKETAGALDKYHGNCDCQPVPIRDASDYPAGYDPDSLYEQYQAAFGFFHARILTGTP